MSGYICLGVFLFLLIGSFIFNGESEDDGSLSNKDISKSINSTKGWKQNPYEKGVSYESPTMREKFGLEDWEEE